MNLFLKSSFAFFLFFFHYFLFFLFLEIEFLCMPLSYLVDQAGIKLRVAYLCFGMLPISSPSDTFLYKVSAN